MDGCIGSESRIHNIELGTLLTKPTLAIRLLVLSTLPVVHVQLGNISIASRCRYLVRNLTYFTHLTSQTFSAARQPDQTVIETELL